MSTGVDAVGRCLCCGGRGGYPADGVPEGYVLTCGRCYGTGQDPAREAQWFRDLIAPLQERTPGGDA